MNKKIKVFMIILAILIIVITGILIIFMIKEQKDKEIELQKGAESTNENVSQKNKLSKVEEKYEYFDVQACVNKFVLSLKKLNKDTYKEYLTYEETEEEIKQYFTIQEKALYNQLGYEYISKFNITEKNVENNLSKYYKINLFNIESMRGIDINDDLSIYVIDGEIFYNDKTTEKYEFIVKKYSADLTFSVYPYEYIKTMNGLDNTLESIKKYDTVENKSDNVYVSKAYDDEYIVSYYFDNFKNNININSNYIYSKLDKEYKQKRFKTLDEFKKYLLEKNVKGENLVLKEYLAEENDDNTINYVCKDQNGDYYIFKQDVIGNYTLMLDTYTVDLPRFITKYNQSSIQTKVMMNIDKIFQMINNKDYASAYKYLADSFKKNNFNTEEKFKNYIENNLYKNNSVTYNTYNNKLSGVYGYELTIKNKENINQSKKFNIVMKLNSGTNFEYSFEI